MNLLLPRTVFLLLFLTFSINFSSAQSNVSLTWDSSIGCVDYDDNVDEFGVLTPIEQIDSDVCIKFCENSEVTFSLNDPDGNIDSVVWNQAGGINSSGNQNADFTVIWINYTNFGNINVQVTLIDGTVIRKAICVEVIAAPVVDFTFLSGLANRCEGDFQLVNNSFDPFGSNLVSHEWTFTNANGTVISSSDVEPNVYLGQGIWTVALTVTNECNCSETKSEEIRVEGESVAITCPTVICENSTETYTIENPGLCNAFSWEVFGGTILSGNNDSIVEVMWNDPVDGFGYLTFNQADCDACQNTPVTVKIPVIEEEGDIIGEEQLCAGEEYLFSLPRWPATVFEWSLLDSSGNPVPFQVDFDITDQPNEIILNTAGLDPGEYLLSSNYNSPLLLCGGFAQHNVSIKDKHIIQAPTQVCVNEEVDFITEILNNNTEWNVYFENNLIDQPIVAQLNNYTFNAPGIYIVTATSPVHCTSDNFLITVVDLPPAIDSSITIEGILEQVCANSPYSYSINLGNDDYYAEWRIASNQGTIQGNTEGETVSVVFNAIGSNQIYNLQVRQVVKNGGCAGPWSDYQITPLSINTRIEHFDPLDPANTTIANQRYHCSSTIANFRVDYEEGETYNWYFADERYGSIVSGQNTNEVTVMINEIPPGGNAFVDLQLQIRKCGVLFDITPFELEIDRGPRFRVQDGFLGDVCSGEDYTLTVAAPTVPSQVILNDWIIEYELVLINPGIGVIQINQPNAIITISPQNVVTVSNVQMPYVDVATNFQATLWFSNQNDCSNFLRIGASTGGTIFPAPRIDITTSGDRSFCSVADIDATLTAVYQNANLGPVNYQWFRNGTAISNQTNNALTITPALGLGNYYCEVSFPNNNPSDCITVTDNTTISLRNCNSDPICVNEQISITSVNWTDCKEIQVMVDNFGGVPTAVEYTVGGSNWSVVTNTNTITGATLESNSDLPPGTYTMRVKAIYPNCSATASVPFTIGYQADIDVDVACVSNNAYDVTIVNTGGVLNSYTGAIISYELVGFGSTITNTTGSHTFNNVPDGNYTARVLINGPGDPVCIATQDVTLESPEATFEILDARDPSAGPITQTCTECPILLRPVNPNPNHTYTWGFLTDGSNTQVSPEISLPVGTQFIKLTVTDENDCSITSPFQQIEVTKGDFNGFYSGAGTYCQDAIIDLSFLNNSPQAIATPNIIPEESGYLWMLETEPAPGVNTNPIYNPTVSGQYWVKLRNTDLCFQDMNTVNVTILPKPFFDIKLPDFACIGEPYRIEGQTTSTGSGIDEYRWNINGSQGPWLTTFPIEPLEQTQNVAGTYTYILEVQATNGCDYQVTKEVVVEPVPNLGGIVVSPDSCNPYTVVLTVQSPQAGTYHWSDGFTGYPHTVTRGGAYQLTFVPDNAACTVALQTYVAKDPSSYLWYFPSGCLDFCEMEDVATRVIPGLSVPFNSWLYDANGSSLSGTGAVAAFDISSLIGTNNSVSLALTNENCTVESEPLVLTQIEECVDCELELSIDEVKLYEEPFIYFELFGVIVNNAGVDLNVQLSISGGNGFFTPSSIFVPAGGSISLNPLRFTPQTPFNGGSTTINLQASHLEGDCFTRTIIEFPEVFVENREAAKSWISVSPNPVDNKATFTYELFSTDMDAVTLEIYNLNGLKMFDTRLQNASGAIEAELSFLKPTQYIVLIRSNGEIVAQTYLIRK